MDNQLRQIIEEAWNDRALLAESRVREAVRAVIEELDKGRLRTAEPIDPSRSQWQVNEWVKKAILLYFPMQEMRTMRAGELEWHDKMDLKHGYEELGVRVVPHAVARYGAYISPGAILMPSYVNIGAWVGAGTMVDTWATVGSCAQVGKNCHLSGGVGIGGVLEPVQAGPTIIEDNCFIGARSEIVEGVVVEENSVISMGVFIGQSTKIYDRTTGEILRGRVPAGAVGVPGSLPSKDGTYNLNCAVIVKRVDAKTRSKTSINDLLRD